MDPDLRDLLSAWQGEDLAEVRRAELLEKLRQDEAFRHAFVEEIHLLGMLKAVQATEPRWLVLEDTLGWSAEGRADEAPLEDRVMRGIQDLPSAPGRYSKIALVLGGLAGATFVLLVAGFWWLVRAPSHSETEGTSVEVAWLLNAQNCRWANGDGPAGDLRPGKVLRLEQGLAELGFRSGASVILQGPATLELRSGNSVRLLRGSLAAQVPEPARGFEVLSPEGKVVDLGTEFGINVAEDGSAQVYVFRGEVQAQPDGKPAAPTPVSVRAQQSARIDGVHGVSFGPGLLGADGFMREIVSPSLVLPRALTLDFQHLVEGTLQDGVGLGTGLTHRLPGTGKGLPTRDPNLRLNREAGRLELTTNRSDLNDRFNLAQGEYLGVRLADLGFTGMEDFSVAVEIPNVPVLETIDQFGLYAGVKSDRNIRGGLLRPSGRKGQGASSLFIVKNDDGRDLDLHEVGLVSVGDELRLTLQRVGRKYSLMVENHTTGESVTLAIPHTKFLDGEPDLYVGLFGATPWREQPRTLFVKGFKVTVWTLSPDKGSQAPGEKKQG